MKLLIKKRKKSFIENGIYGYETVRGHWYEMFECPNNCITCPNDYVYFCSINGSECDYGRMIFCT